MHRRRQLKVISKQMANVLIRDISQEVVDIIDAQAKLDNNGKGTSRNSLICSILREWAENKQTRVSDIKYPPCVISTGVPNESAGWTD